jgi:hypothetical protein
VRDLSPLEFDTAVRPWACVHAAELIDLRDDGLLFEAVPQAPGIYVWKRHFDTKRAENLPPDDLRAWVQALCAQAAARMPGAVLTHFMRTDGINIGGGDLPIEKLKELTDVSHEPKKRRQLLRFIELLSCFTPPLYIGQANDLRRRAKEHLDGNTALYAYVHETLGLTWRDIVFFYLKTSPSVEVGAADSEEAFRELLELTSQRLLAPFGVRRPG